MRMRKPSARRRVNERGSILGMSAIAMLAILGAVGLGIDISHMYLAATELQNAADAAALAGASALNGGAGGIKEGVNRAIATMNRYEFNRTSVTLARSDVTFAASLAGFANGGTSYSEGGASSAGVVSTIKFVKVRIPAKTISTVVARAFMQASLEDQSQTVAEFAVGRSAVAGQSRDINSICNFVPFAIMQEAGKAALTLAPAPNCANTAEHKTTFTKGCAYTTKLSSGNGNSVSGGDFVLLSLPVTRSGDPTDVRRLMAIGVDSCATAGVTKVSQDKGAKVGQVSQGINTRFDDYNGSGMNPTAFPPDTNIKSDIVYADYKEGLPANSVAPSSPGLPDRRVLIIPILDVKEFNDNNGVDVPILKFGAFFLRKKVTGNNGGLVIEYIGTAIVIGNGSFDPNGGGVTQGFTVPVLYQ